MQKLSKIEELIEAVTNGGSVKTGVDVLNDRGVLLLEKDVLVSSVSVLLILKQNGLKEILIDSDGDGGIWDQDGNLIQSGVSSDTNQEKKIGPLNIKEKVEKIKQLREEAHAIHSRAQSNVKKVLADIKKTGGRFDQGLVESTVDDIFIFLSKNEDAFSHLTKDIFSYDNYLYNHSVNVCAYGMAVLQQFNNHFSQVVNKHLNSMYVQNGRMGTTKNMSSFVFYYPEDLKEIAMGYFLHDIGKAMIPEPILNKQGKLSNEEFDLAKTHSYQLGSELLEKNKISNSTISNVVMYHHAAIFKDEDRAYPQDKHPIELPPYVKICKLVDVYDAMTSKRSYKEAVNPILVVTDVFRKYAVAEDPMLGIILQSFVNSVGIYPPGSCVFLRNGQLSFVLDSQGPIVIPFTDTQGKPTEKEQDALDLSSKDLEDKNMKIDRRKPPLSLKRAYNNLPNYIKKMLPDSK